MDRKAKQVKAFNKLSSIIFGKKLTDWSQLDDVLTELNDRYLMDYAYEHAYLIQQWLNENRYKGKREKLADIIHSKNLTSWGQCEEVLNELNDPLLRDYARENEYLVMLLISDNWEK